MRNVGYVLMVLALASLALKAFGLDLLHARWVDAAGEVAGYALRGALAAFGLALAFGPSIAREALGRRR